MKGYNFAIEWIARNDDTEFLLEDDPFEFPSVSVMLVANLYQKHQDVVIKDLLKYFEKNPRK